MRKQGVYRRIMNEAEKKRKKTALKTERVVEYYQLTYLLVVIKAT
jgi:hypothetical protein